MSPDSRKTAPATPAPAQAKAAKSASPKNRNINLKTLRSKLKKITQKFSAHFAFIVIIAILLIYLYLVWNIRALVTAEPSTEAENAALSATKVPRIDQNAINRIQSLESNSPDIRALFNQARNNPFNE